MNKVDSGADFDVYLATTVADFVGFSGDGRGEHVKADF